MTERSLIEGYSGNMELDRSKIESNATKPEEKKKRVRLPPEIRRRQILDAALIEFGSLGFTAASISKIADRAGTSKANLYVHFANKDEIFKTLLSELLSPQVSLWLQTRSGQKLDELTDTFIEQIYDGLTPQVIALIRLLISESHRMPVLIQRWYEDTIVPARAEQQRRIDEYVAEKKIQSTPLTDHFSLVMAPVLYAAMVKIIFGQDVAERECQKTKETHRKVLHMLLKSLPDRQ